MHASMAPFERLPVGGSSAWERAGVWCWRAQHVRHVSRGLCSSSFRCILLAPDAPALRRERSALSLDMDRVIPTPCSFQPTSNLVLREGSTIASEEY